MSALAPTLAAYRNALERFRQALAEPHTTLVRDATIKRFEFTFELAWKTIQRYLRSQGIVCNSPKDCLRQAFVFQWIRDNPHWLRMIEDRNMTVHTYDEETATRIYKNLADYLPLFEELAAGLERLAREQQTLQPHPEKLDL